VNFDKIEPMSTGEIFAWLNRLGVAVTPEDYRMAAQRHGNDRHSNQCTVL
jgi:hypothetical protein